MANWYVSNVAYAAVAQWAATTAYTLGQYVRQLAAPTLGNERVFKVTTAGTSGGTEPTWVLSLNGSTSDGSVVWKEITGQETEQTSGNWKAPAAFVSQFPANHTTLGDTVFVAHDHTEAVAVAVSFGVLNVPFFNSHICVNRTGSVPPVSADLATTAVIGTTGVNNITFRNIYAYGITYNAGSGASTANIVFGGVLDKIVLENCLVCLNNTSTSSIISVVGGFGIVASIKLINTPMKFGSASQKISQGYSGLLWVNTPNAIQGTAPTTLFDGGSSTGAAGRCVLRGVDLSALAGTISAIPIGRSSLSLMNCQLNSAVTPMPALSGTAGTFEDDTFVAIDNCDDSTNSRNFRFLRVYTYGNVQQDVTVVRTSGASDGATSYSWKMLVASGLTPSVVHPLTSPTLTKRQNAVGAPKTATIEIIHFGSTALTNALAWLEVEYLGSSTAPLSSFVSSRVADALGTTSASAATLTASTQTWDGAAPARANNHAYVVGDVIKLASNPGRVFMCVTLGTSASSEPAGYATAVDGGSVTDGTGSAVFRAGWRYKISVTFTPQMAGVLNAVVKFAGVNKTLYVDPKLAIV